MHAYRNNYVRHVVLVAALIVGLIAVALPQHVWAGNTDTPLQEYLSVGQCTDATPYQVAVAGIGMAGKTQGTIHLELPNTATVYKAYLYWTGIDPFDGGDGTIQFEGSTFNAGDAHTEQIGGPAFWSTNNFAFAYRADVTDLVSPTKSDYTFTDPFSGDPNQFDIPYGAALVVVYQDSAVSQATVVETWEGMDIAQGSSSPAGSEGISPIRFDFLPAAVDRTLHLSTVVGGTGSGTDGTKVYYLVGSGTPPSGDIYNNADAIVRTVPAAEDDAYMTTYDDTITVPAGAEWVIVQVQSPDPNGDQVHWLAETFQMEAACPKVDVAKTRTSPALVHNGDDVVFRIDVTNTGNTILETVPLTDTFDATYLSYASASVSPDSQSTGTLHWDDITTALGDISPGVTKSLTITFTAAAGTQSLPGDVTTNTATVSGATDQNDRTAPEDSDSDSVEISNPSYTLTKTRVSPADPDDVIVVGEQVVYRITVQNTGDTALVSIPLQDTFDATKFNFVSASISPDNQSGGTLTWNDITGSSDLAPGNTINVNVTLQAIASTGGASSTNTATTSNVTDENGETLNDQTDTAYVKVTQPCVSIEKTLLSDTTAPLNSEVIYRITVTNCGDTVLTTVPVTDSFPTDYLDYASATLTPDSINESGGTLSWDDVTGSSDLGVGDSLTFDVHFTAVASSNPDTLTNTACVNNATDSNGDHPSNVCDDDDTLVTTHPEVNVQKERLSDSPVLVGDTVQFRITVSNVGDTAITVLPLNDSFDSSKLQFVSATPSPDTTGSGSLSWNDLTGSGSLAVGDSVQVTLTFTALASTTPSTTVNTATVSGAQDENGDSVPQDSDTADVAILSPASIGNFVWLDANGNGIQDAGEAGLDGVTVQLYDDSDTLQDQTTTSGGGFYLFEHLFPGDYYVKVVPPSGYSITAKDQGTDDAVDSDADPSTGKMAVTTLDEGENDMTWDAGLYRPAAIGNFVWEDVNGNGIQDAGEPGIANVTVHLYGAGPDGTFGTSDDTSDTMTTATGGIYEFTNLPPGKYYLKFDPPTGYSITLKDQGTDDTVDSDADRSSGVTAQTDLVSGETDHTWDAGLYRPATIGDRVWKDTNGNGVQDAGEAGFENVTVHLYDSSDTLIDTTQTGTDGIYHFTNLLPGSYTVRVDTPSGYTPTTPTEVSRTLSSGDNVDDADFGFISPTSVQLLSFDIQVSEDGVHLAWRTLSEENVTAFRIQRMVAHTGTWVDIASVVAQGRGASYTYVDANVRPGFTYAYRLVSVPNGEVLGPWSVSIPTTWDPGVGSQSGFRTFIPFVSH